MNSMQHVAFFPGISVRFIAQGSLAPVTGMTGISCARTTQHSTNGNNCVIEDFAQPIRISQIYFGPRLRKVEFA
jgi:hypothetical protein